MVMLLQSCVNQDVENIVLNLVFLHLLFKTTMTDLMYNFFFDLNTINIHIYIYIIQLP